MGKYYYEEHHHGKTMDSPQKFRLNIQTCKKIKYYLDDSISRQLVSDVPLGMMLSGGLDSSIITAYASKYFKDCPERFQMI